MFLLNNLKFDIYAPHTIGDTQYPYGWFVGPDERDRIGIVEVDDPIRPNDRLFDVVENPDGSYTATPKADEELAVLLNQDKQDILANIDAKTETIIVNNFIFRGSPIRMNDVDQKNFEGEYRQIKDYLEDGVPPEYIFPTKFKVSTNDQGAPVYIIFNAFADIKSFIYTAKTFIKSTLKAGWALKETVCLMTAEQLSSWVDPR